MKILILFLILNLGYCTALKIKDDANDFNWFSENIAYGTSSKEVIDNDPKNYDVNVRVYISDISTKKYDTFSLELRDHKNDKIYIVENEKNRFLNLSHPMKLKKDDIIKVIVKVKINTKIKSENSEPKSDEINNDENGVITSWEFPFKGQGRYFKFKDYGVYNINIVELNPSLF